MNEKIDESWADFCKNWVLMQYECPAADCSTAQDRRRRMLDSWDAVWYEGWPGLHEPRSGVQGGTLKSELPNSKKSLRICSFVSMQYQSKQTHRQTSALQCWLAIKIRKQKKQKKYFQTATTPETCSWNKLVTCTAKLKVTWCQHRHYGEYLHVWADPVFQFVQSKITSELYAVGFQLCL